jgi:hypothetical protein
MQFSNIWKHKTNYVCTNITSILLANPFCLIAGPMSVFFYLFLPNERVFLFIFVSKVKFSSKGKHDTFYCVLENAIDPNNLGG